MLKELKRSYQLLDDIKNDALLLELIQRSGIEMSRVFKGGYKVLLAGNGGSAADSQHLAAELVGRFAFERPSLPSVALTTDTSILTAIGNDYGYEHIFSRQINALGVKGDMFIAISTSGNSKNITEALKACKEKGIFTIGMTGSSGGAAKELCDICLCMPSDITQKIQEAHILVGHTICAYVEETIFPDYKPQVRYPLKTRL